MVTAMAFSALLILSVAAARVIHRIDAQRAERTTVQSYDGPSTERKHPAPTAGQPFPEIVAQPAAVRPRRDNRDGGRGRLRPRRRNTGV